MAIRSDHWIRRMSTQHGMIEPFESGQVRNGAISYGCSSFGYDIRVADEYKVFTDVHSVVVDPKAFSEKSFVDISGEGHCIIPPNSFALARTLEYFRIPADTLVICVGKSTYARCFRGDTRVALVDGSCATLEEMAEGAERGESYWGYSIGPRGRVIVSMLERPRSIGRDALLEIELDNGEAIRCTPDHEFLLRDGRLAIADDLRPGTPLMPLYRTHALGYEAVYQPLNGSLYSAHRMVDEWNLRHGQTGADVDGCSTAIEEAFAAVGGGSAPLAALNHKVARIRPLPGDHDVYCLTVPEAGNFALEAGVFVRNCGIIVNVTPLEPEWEGHLTLEISNTTPLPAKIYSNEGIAQLLFFEGDEIPSVTYAARSGKYQKQEGVTLPRM